MNPARGCAPNCAWTSRFRAHPNWRLENRLRCLTMTSNNETTVRKRNPMSIRVSIVEDNNRVRGSLARLIALSDGFKCVSEHSTGEEALAALPTFKPDVVLMDINLPGMNGV